MLETLAETCIHATLGEPNPTMTWEAAIIIQGPYVKPHTERVISIFLERNPPNVLVIVSTYLPPEEMNGDNIIGSFLSKYETSILENSKSPNNGRLVYIFVRTPGHVDCPDFWKTNFLNQNRQRLTTFAGLQYAKHLSIPFALKCRSEAFLGLRNICKSLIRLVERYPLLLSQSSPPNLEGRIVVSDFSRTQASNPRRQHLGEHHIADFWLFGHTDDMMNYFDMRSGSPWNGGKGINTCHDVEENLAECWMRNVNISRETKLKELAARYLIVVDSVDVEYVWLKRHHSFEIYLERGRQYLAQCMNHYQREWVLLHHQEWLELVHCWNRADQA